jgi:hypothetical protein
METGETWRATTQFEVRSRVVGNRPVITETSHPLVLLYSAPPCNADRIRVRFRRSALDDWQHTPWQPCISSKSANFYLAGMRADTNYTIEHEIQDGSEIEVGPTLRARTGLLGIEMPSFLVRNGPNFATSREEGILLQSINGGEVYELVFPVATDLAGEVVWYYEYRDADSPVFPWHAGEYLVRPLPGGGMLLFLNYNGGFDQVLRKVNLVGNPLRETNVEAVNHQLQARGEDTIGYFHHEANLLPNGHLLLLGSIERMVTNVQGPGQVNVLGDMAIALDENWQVVWTWNPFDHLDVSRIAVLDEICTVVTVGCPPISLSTTAKDWTHANSIAYSPSDGNLLLSLRNQDWIIKVDYQDGKGKGDVIWRLGKDGDFTLAKHSDPYPWFSHQHDIFFENNKLAVFDNGNTRCDGVAFGCRSRGQVYAIDEKTMTARLLLNADVGSYSTAFGSAQRLANGNYHFLSGILVPQIVSQSVEVTPYGDRVYLIETEGGQYRSFRMPNLYSPVLPEYSPETQAGNSTFLPVLER